MPLAICFVEVLLFNSGGRRLSVDEPADNLEDFAKRIAPDMALQVLCHCAAAVALDGSCPVGWLERSVGPADDDSDDGGRNALGGAGSISIPCSE